MVKIIKLAIKCLKPSFTPACPAGRRAGNPSAIPNKPERLRTSLGDKRFSHAYEYFGNRIIFCVFLSVLFSFLFSADFLFSETNAVPGEKDKAYSKEVEMQGLLRSIGKKVSGFKSLKTDFVQEKELAMFKKKIVLRGRIYMQKPDRLAWHVDKPVKYSVVITDKAIRQWDEDTNQVQELSLSKNPVFKDVVNQLSVWFSGEYGALMDDNSVSVQQQQPLIIEFVPNEKNIARKMIKSISITFRDDEKYLKKIKIHEMSGDTTTLDFFNTLLDVPLESSFFEVKRV